MLSEDLLAILACPYCRTRVEQVGNWLICQNAECQRKYPIRDEIPVMLIKEGDKYRDIPVEQLPKEG